MPSVGGFSGAVLRLDKSLGSDSLLGPVGYPMGIALAQCELIHRRAPAVPPKLLLRLQIPADCWQILTASQRVNKKLSCPGIHYLELINQQIRARMLPTEPC